MYVDIVTNSDSWMLPLVLQATIILILFCGILDYKSFDSFRNTVLTLLQVGKLSTGDSLDMSPHDEAAILANDATIKDMEVSFCSVFICLAFIIHIKLDFFSKKINNNASKKINNNALLTSEFYCIGQKFNFLPSSYVLVS